VRTSSPTTDLVGPTTARSRFLLVIADPDEGSARRVATELARHQVDTELCPDAADALLAAGIMRPDAVLVSAYQRGMTSVDMVRALCHRAGLAVVVGVGGSDGPVAAAALATGAAACVARPYRVPELIPIMRAIRPGAVATAPPRLTCGTLNLDPATLEVRLEGVRIELPRREYEVLRLLMSHVDRVVTREQLHERVWKEPVRAASNTLTVHIRRLRQRLGDDQRHPRIIITVRGIGYRLIPPGTRSR
jgi:DNA-binding response OmpR family regulator